MKAVTSYNPNKKVYVEKLKATSGGSKVTNVRENDTVVAGDCLKYNPATRGYDLLGQFEIFKKGVAPIQEIHVSSAGDPSVGIPGVSFTIGSGFFYDPGCLAKEDQAKDLEYHRGKLKEVFSEMFDEAVTVLFDFEVKESK